MRILIILLLINCVACTQKDEIGKKKKKESRAESARTIALRDGDDFAYGSYIEFAQIEGIKYEQLSVSLMMNQKFDNERSYYYIYRYMVEINNNFKYRAEYVANMNNIDRIFAMSYLTKGAIKNRVECQMELEKIYRNGYNMPIDLKKSDSLYKIIEKSSGVGDFYIRHRQNKYKVDEIGG